MLTNENFRNEFAKNEFSLVLIGGGGCANCTTMSPIIQNVGKKFENLQVYIVDASEQNKDINTYYKVQQVPTILFLFRDELISKVQGYQPEEILEIYIESKMEEYKAKAMH
ncbi:thioredoxin [Breznakia blatticola]|uniref:Thioredoxin n=1 Tax=Breznakia blatticola TaxID=1754012 RepID=A0A4R7ZFC4_9FIRM|nr:thioredoxin family protein [Breznakia blatticola]TDW16309.1 thioredoxin [Breznakia blatticola]